MLAQLAETIPGAVYTDTANLPNDVYEDGEVHFTLKDMTPMANRHTASIKASQAKIASGFSKPTPGEYIVHSQTGMDVFYPSNPPASELTSVSGNFILNVYKELTNSKTNIKYNWGDIHKYANYRSTGERYYRFKAKFYRKGGASGTEKVDPVEVVWEQNINPVATINAWQADGSGRELFDYRLISMNDPTGQYTTANTTFGPLVQTATAQNTAWMTIGQSMPTVSWFIGAIATTGTRADNCVRFGDNSGNLSHTNYATELFAVVV